VKKLLLAICVPLVAACDDGLGPQFWDATPDTVLILSSSRPEYIGLVSAVDVTASPVTPLPIEAAGVTGQWDFMLADQGDGMVLLPASVVPAIGSRARIAVLLNQNFDDVREAPRDTVDFSASAVPLRPDAVYVVRSRLANCGFSNGYRYAKLKPVEINVPRGLFRFAIVRNPFCDDRSFVPPEE
jgi:hypothetical protein